MSIRIGQRFTEGAAHFIPTGLAYRKADAGGGVVYIGEAVPGSLPSAAVWRIQRITTASNDETVEWADGNDNFDNVWNNRASLSYS